jgi:hypothetical protein
MGRDILAQAKLRIEGAVCAEIARGYFLNSIPGGFSRCPTVRGHFRGLIARQIAEHSIPCSVSRTYLIVLSIYCI